MGSKYTEKEASKDTGVPVSTVTEVWHSARDEVRKTGFRDPKGLDDPEWRKKTDEELEESFSSGGLCYIATATLGSGAYRELEMLKSWRYSVLESVWAGRFLSDYYREISPPVALSLRKHDMLRACMREAFVRPALWLLKLKPRGRIGNFLLNIAVLWIFLVGLLIGTVANWILSFKTDMPG